MHDFYKNMNIIFNKQTNIYRYIIKGVLWGKDM